MRSAIGVPLHSGVCCGVGVHACASERGRPRTRVHMALCDGPTSFGRGNSGWSCINCSCWAVIAARTAVLVHYCTTPRLPIRVHVHGGVRWGRATCANDDRSPIAMHYALYDLQHAQQAHHAQDSRHADHAGSGALPKQQVWGGEGVAHTYRRTYEDTVRETHCPT
jgi:hypothetical protein